MDEQLDQRWQKADRASCFEGVFNFLKNSGETFVTVVLVILEILNKAS